MTDQEPGVTPASSLSTEIGASLASVWARYVGSRPSGTRIEFDGSVVRWILPDGIDDLESGLSGTDGTVEATQPARTMRGYKRETSAAVSKATRRRVRARMSKQDAKTGVATETFILEAVRRRP